MGHQPMKRNNKSYTKLTSLHPAKTSSTASINRAANGLQPFTKTNLNNSTTRGSAMQPLTKTVLRELTIPFVLHKIILNSSQKGGFSTLTRNKSEQSIKSNKSNSSLKLANPQHGRLKSSAKRGRAIIKLNEEYPDENYEDISNDSEAEDDQERTRENNAFEREKSRQYSTDRMAEDVDSEDRSSNNYNAEQLPKQENPLSAYRTTYSSSEDLTSRNLYGGSFLLSQSTGMTKKVGPNGEALDYGSFAEKSSTGSKALDNSSSGIVFKTGEKRDPESEPTLTKTNVSKGSSYHANQTIFSNLQRNDLQFLSNAKPQRPQLSEKNSQVQLCKKNFAGYLENNNTPGNSGLETRTQQRLWLQRENSLMDVSSNLDPSRLTNFSNLSLNKLMFAHNMSSGNIRDMHLSRQGSSAGHDFAGAKIESSMTPNAEQTGNFNNFMNIIQNVHQNSIQSRTEFERLNREYVNVRRHLNPVAASLARIERYLLNESRSTCQKYEETSNRASDEQSLESYKAQQINRLWQDALHTSSASSVSLKKYQDDQLQHQYQQEQRNGPDRGGRNEDMLVRERTNKINVSGSLPSTRAVKSGGITPKR